MKNDASLQSREEDFSDHEIAPGVKNFFPNDWSSARVLSHSGINLVLMGVAPMPMEHFLELVLASAQHQRMSLALALCL